LLEQNHSGKGMARKQGNRRFVPAGLTRILIVESSPLLFGQALYLPNVLQRLHFCQHGSETLSLDPSFPLDLRSLYV
jgi:hypothetical protein